MVWYYHEMRLIIIIIMRTKYHNNLIRKIPGDVMCCNVG